MRVALQRVLKVQPGEERLTVLLFAEMFLLGIGFNFVETSVFPLFLSEFDSGTLPYLYILNAVVVTVITAFYLRLGRRLVFGRQLLVLLGFVTALVFGFWLALTLGGGRPVTFALPVLFQIAVNMAQLGFWTMAARLMTLRQSKRLFGLVGSGMWVAIVLTGFLIAPIVRVIGTINLLLIATAGFAGALALLGVIVRGYREPLHAVDAAGPVETKRDSLVDYLRNPYIALMFALTIVAWLSFYFVDNIFYNRVSAQFPEPAVFSAFMGLYLSALGVFTLFNNLFLTGFIINRFGVRVGLFILPALLFVVMLAFSVVGAGWGLVPLLFWLATIARVLDLGLLFSVDQTAQSILYQPLPAADRARVQTIDNGIVRMVAVGLAGGSLLLLNQVLAFDVVRLAFVLLTIVIGWLVVVYLTSRAYPRVLAAALARRRLTGVTLSLDDGDTVRVLRESLHNPRPGPALYALGLLADHRPDALTDALPDLLAHPSAPVRLETLRRIESLRLPAAGLQTLADGDHDPHVRGEAWRVLAATADPAVESGLLAQLDGDEREVRLAALAGLRAHGRPDARARANAIVAMLAASASRDDRLLAARALRDAPQPEDCAILGSLLRDSDVDVGREALATMARAACPDLWPVVVEVMARRGANVTAVAALVAGGDAALPAIAAALDRAETPWESAAALARALGRMGGVGAISTLLAHLDHPSDAVRTEILRALSHAGYQATADETALLRARIVAETRRAAWLLAGMRDCTPSDEIAYLRRVLQDQFAAARDRVLLLLSLLYDRAAMLDVHDALGRTHRPSDARRSYALEVLDLRLPGDLKALVMPLVDDLTPAARLQGLGAAFEQPALSPRDRVETMLLDDAVASHWLRVCEVHAAGRLRCSGSGLTPLLERYQNDADPVLRETAARAYALIGAPDAVSPAPGERDMLSTIEKVIILKDVDLFAGTPDDLLAEVAGLLAEVECVPGQAIFAKGDAGDSLYIIVSGEVRIHDGDYTINLLGETEVFGEMALLDPEPRMASATAASDALLLRLDQEPFFELMDTRSEVARGIIRVLSARLRQRVSEVATLRGAQA